MNSTNIVGGVFCDFQKAFDYVNHNILLEKLKFYGIKSTFYTLVKISFGRKISKSCYC